MTLRSLFGRGTRRGLVLAYVLMLGLFVAAPAQAQWQWTGSAWYDGVSTEPTLRLADLAATNLGTTVQVGDKTFSFYDDFVVTGATSTNLVGGPYTTDDIEDSVLVTGYFYGSNPGLLFSSDLLRVDDTVAALDSSLDLNFSFLVTAPGPFIEAAQMIIPAGGASASDGTTVGDDSLNISEIVYKLVNPLDPFGAVEEVANLVVGLPAQIFEGDELGPFASDDIIPALQSVKITKDIALLPGSSNTDLGVGGVDGGYIELLYFAQAFQQVPEPGTLLLATAGMTLMLVRRRTRA